jgi:hypothetical protein
MAATTRTRRVSAVFRGREAAERAYQALCDRGYSRDRINLAMSDETRKDFEAGDLDKGNLALEGAGAGGAIGTIAGGLIGAIAAIGTNLIIPGLGLVVAGPLAAGLAGAGAGALTGGLIGAMIGWGIPEEHAPEYERGIKEGGVVMVVEPDTIEEADAIERDWRNGGAARVDRF